MKTHHLALPLALLLLGLPAHAGLSPKLKSKLRALGAPMSAVAAAFKESQRTRRINGKVQFVYPRRELFSVFDISQPSNKKRFYVIEWKKNKVSAYYSSHGRGNGHQLRATIFTNFNRSNDGKMPLGPQRTGEAFIYNRKPGFTNVRDSATGRTYRNRTMLILYGVKKYNENVFPTKVGHTKSYATLGFRKKYGYMGRSLGCLVLDPRVSKAVFNKIQNGSLLYTAVGNKPIKYFIPKGQDRDSFNNGVGRGNPHKGGGSGGWSWKW